MNPRDLFWLLAYPVYQLIGTLRHEGSHAAMGMIEGARVQRFVFLPRWSESRGWVVWGSVGFDGSTTWLTSAAPYLVDLLTYGLFFLACRYLRPPRWVWLNLVILGMVSPLVNSAYAYACSFWLPTNDVVSLLHALPPVVVHGYFAATLIAYVVGLLVVFRRRLAG